MEPCKKWYRSKTMWFNIAVQVGAVAAILGSTLPMLAGIISVKAMAISMFVLALVNQGLRAITEDGVEL